MFQFANDDFVKIEKLLGGKFEDCEQCKRMVLVHQEENRKLSLEIYPGISIGEEQGNLISVYTETAHMQLHFCSGYVISDMLGEITFIGEHHGRINGLIIERSVSCSMYSNVNKSILSGDFTQLGPEVMLSGIALSLAEPFIPDDEDDNECDSE